MSIELNKQNAIAFYRMAYNGDPKTAVERYGRAIPPFPETREYVRRVKILYKRYRQSDTNQVAQNSSPRINAAQ